MDIREISKKCQSTSIFAADLSGWLAIVADELRLIEEDCFPHFESAASVRICDQRIKFLLRGSVVLLGGPSFVFHKARVSGTVKCGLPVELEVAKLSVDRDRTGNFLELDCSNGSLEASRLRFEGEFSETGSNLWD